MNFFYGYPTKNAQKRVPLAGFLVLAFLGSGCGVLNQELRFQMGYLDVESAHSSALAMGFPTESEHYRQALKKWPWVSGGQLQRRALILSLVEAKNQKKKKKIFEKLAEIDQAESKKNRSSALQKELFLIEELQNL